MAKSDWQSILANHFKLFIMTLSVVICIAILAGSFLIVKQDKSDSLAQATVEAARAAETFDEFFRQSIRQVDSMIQAVKAYHSERIGNALTEHFIKKMQLDAHYIESVRILNSTGYPVISVGQNTPFPDKNLQDSFLYQKAKLTNELYISPAWLDADGEYRLNISRSINKPDGRFGGIVNVTVNLQLFSDYLKAIRFNMQNAAGIIGLNDQNFRIYDPFQSSSSALASDIKPVWSALRYVDSGVVETLSSEQEGRTAYAFKKIQGLPLVVVIGFSDHQISDQLAVQNKLIFWFGGILILLVILVAAFIIEIHERNVKLNQANITLKRLNQEIHEIALHDQLTGLPSRVLLAEHFNTAISGASRGENVSICVLFIDLDGFKAINDSFGHDAGDALLKALAVRMKSVVRPTDTVSRYGGDEFIIILPGLSGESDLIQLTQRLLLEVKKPVDFKGQSLQVSASIGVSKYPENGKTLNELMIAADDAMYQAKNKGKNQACLYAVDNLS